MKDILFCIYKSLQLMNIPYSKKYVNNFIESHTESRSMLCLSDLFDSYNVENTGGEFENKTEIINYPGTHISQLVDRDTVYFVVVESIKENTITYYNEGKKVAEDLEDYFKKWQGFALFFTKRKDSAEPNYAENLKETRLNNFKILLYIISISILFVASLYACMPIILPVPFMGLIFLKLMGIAVSILLISYTYNSDNLFIKEICNVGKKTNCGNILKSKAAKVFSFLSWSEVGLFYFATTLLTLIISEIHQQIQGYYLIVGINMLALPYTLYSVYYQKKVAKSWCVMCLSIQALLLLEFCVGISTWSSLSLQNIIFPLITISLSSLFIITTWYLIKPLLEANSELAVTKKDLRKFKQNISLFHYTLSNQPKVSYPKQAEVLRFGSMNPKIHFTIFTSPVCAYCSKTHTVINKLLDNYPNDVAFTEIFAVSNDERDERVKLAAHMLQLHKKIEKGDAHRAINDWHADENKKMEKWMAKYPVIGDAIAENREIIGLHNSIAKSLGITHTPIIVMNGKLLPDLYKVEDLEKIIPAFLATLEHTN